MRLQPRTYALTTVTYDRHPIFQRTENAQLMIDTLARYRERGEFLLHAFVVMPDHLHIILTPQESIERAAQLIKGGLSFSLRKSYRGEIWQPGFHEHRIRDQEDLANQTAYILANPTRKHLKDYHHIHTAHPTLIRTCTLTKTSS